MATLTLGSIGTAVGGPLGGFIGASIGSVIDNFLIAPALFGSTTNTITGPRAEDIQLSAASEGTPIPFVLGPEVRVSGVIAWKGDIEIVSNTTRQGGKGGAPQQTSVTRRTAYTDVRVHVTETNNTGIVSLSRVWANEKLIAVDDAPFDGDFVSNQVGFWGLGDYELDITPYSLGGQSVTKRKGRYVQLVSWDDGLDLSQYKPGMRLNIQGATQPQLNHDPVGTPNGFVSSPVPSSGSGTGINPFTGLTDDYTWVRVIHSGGGKEYPIGATSGEPRWEANLEGSITVELVQGTIPKLYYDSFTTYVGGDSQTTPDGTMEEVEGAGNVPGYLKMAGFVIERLNLTDFGNFLPRFNALVKERESITCGEAIEELLALTELPSSLYDASACTGNLKGLQKRGVQPVANLITTLGIAYDLIIREVDGVYTFEPRTATVDATIDRADLGAAQPGARRTRSIERERASARTLPDEVVVSYSDPDRSYQTGSRRVRKIESGKREVLELDMPLTLTSEQAGRIAERVLWSAWAEREAVRFSLPPKYLYLRPGDLVEVEDDTGEDIQVRISSIVTGANFNIVVTGIIEDTQLISPVWPDDNNQVTQSLPSLLESIPFAFNGPALREEDLDQPTLYLAFANPEAPTIPLSAVFQKVNDASSFTQTGATADTASICGYVMNLVPAGPTQYWDRASEIIVELIQGELTSSTEVDVLAGANRAMVGDELVGFVNAEHLGGNQYKLTTLLRGLRDTVFEMNQQAIGEGAAACPGDGLDESGYPIIVAPIGPGGGTPPDPEDVCTGVMPFILLGDGIVPYAQPASSNLNRYEIKAVPDGQDEADFTETVKRRHTLRTLRPFAPCNINAVESGSDVVVTWDRRSRGFYQLFNPGGMPRWDPDEVWLVERINLSDVVLQSVEVSNATTYTFTGISLPQKIRIRRRSAQYGDGPTFERLIS